MILTNATENNDDRGCLSNCHLFSRYRKYACIRM